MKSCTLWLAGLVVAIAAGAGPGSTDSPSRATINDLAFMTGGWRTEYNGSTLEEHYTAPRNGSLVGLFRWDRDGKLNMTEHIVIEQRPDGVRLLLRHFNAALVPWEQEADGPTTFALDEVRDGRAVFVSDRAFPKRIIYSRVGPDRLVARLEGERNGEPHEMEFSYRSTSMTATTETLTDAGLSLGYDGGLTIAFQVKDLSRSIDWYQNVLGFKIQYHLEEMGWCELTTSVGRVNVGLSQVEQVKVGGPTPTFGVKDIDQARSQLEGKGVRFDGDTIEIPQMVKLATFFDPDGNSLMFFESLSDQMP